ncbi:MAG TPA: secondary thiamine-phosphate synthase enzyme YjbQ [Gammaproteobacteria bacterium]
MQKVITLSSNHREELIDITEEVRAVVRESGVRQGLCALYAQGATAAMMIQENWDDSVRTDVVHLLQKLIPRGVWLHDQQDGNGDAHLKAGLVGPSETVPIVDGNLGLSQWQNIFFCEFDGPRSKRQVVCTIITDD